MSRRQYQVFSKYHCTREDPCAGSDYPPHLTGMSGIGISQIVQRRKWIKCRIKMPHILQGIRCILRHTVSIYARDPSNNHINTSTDSRGSPDVSILYPSSHCDPVDIGAKRCGLRPGSLVGCGVFPIENARPGCYACALDNPFQYFIGEKLGERTVQMVIRYLSDG